MNDAAIVTNKMVLDPTQGQPYHDGAPFVLQVALSSRDRREEIILAENFVNLKRPMISSKLAIIFKSVHAKYDGGRGRGRVGDECARLRASRTESNQARHLC